VAETKWVPRPGEVISLDADPAAKGHEQAGVRRYVVLTRQGINDKTGLLTCVPITTKVKGYPGEVPISEITASGKAAVAFAFQVFTVDWRARDAGTYGYFASPIEMKDIRDFLKAYLSIS
jgi:mRNA interferase MazF